MSSSHDTDDGLTPSDVQPARGRLAFAVVLTAAILIAEVTGGIWFHSVALLSDAAHVLTDLVSLALSLGAIIIATRPVSKEHTFGWHRAEVLAALLNGVVLLLVAGGLLRESYLRLQNPPEVQVVGMFWVAAAGLIANGIIAFRLRGHAHRDLNIRSAYLHVLADLGGSVGVVLAAIIMLPTGWYMADPILGMAISVAVLFGSARLLRDTAHILLEGVPRGVDLNAVAEVVKSTPGVEDIHDLHIWTICSNILALSVHVTVGDRSAAARDEIVRAINDELRLRFQIAETTVQTERTPCRTDELIHVVPHSH
ncbi:MAG: cation transporter [Armatimonadota bacterium]|nr:MAG: cation transporter [Armatimonadota bacterium]